jgi:hypothetical protein
MTKLINWLESTHLYERIWCVDGEADCFYGRCEHTSKTVEDYTKQRLKCRAVDSEHSLGGCSDFSAILLAFEIREFCNRFWIYLEFNQPLSLEVGTFRSWNGQLIRIIDNADRTLCMQIELTDDIDKIIAVMLEFYFLKLKIQLRKKVKNDQKQ